ncbi:MAG: PD-(D/E)XK nuclease family protein [Endomicrobiaceae bacterium]|jgi:hypothetical protein|nr:PD-(D/E)XK nuclease family protein [Endomicrobiaceae bacterium]
MKLPKIKKFPYTNILGWSVSRYDVFNNCKRQYFYSYYPKFDKENSLEKITQLKSLTSFALEVGNIAHDVIRDLLFRLQKTAKPIAKKQFMQYALKMTEDYCAKKTFTEVYYGQKQSVTASDLFPSVSKILENFLQSPRLKWIFETAVAANENWVIEPDGFGETRINDYKAYCKVDFLIPVNDKIYILDWKTGKQDISKHSKQLTGYSLWASYHFAASSKDIAPTIVYLAPSYSEYSIELTDDILEKFKEQVAEETKQMYEFLTDIENNIPKNKEEFKKTDNGFFCKYCNFREICQEKY